MRGKNPLRWFRARYILGLACIALLTLTTHGLIQTLILSESKRSHIINLAGRQRMLSQKIAKEALARDDEGLRETVVTWSAAHDGLIHGSEELGLPATRDDAILKLYEGIGPAYEAMLGAALRLLNAEVASDRDAALAVLLASEGEYLRKMNAIVYAKSDMGQAHVKLLQRLELVAGLATLVILLLEAFLIFEPLSRQLQRSWQALAGEEERFRLATLGSRDVIWDWDLAADRMYLSPRLLEILGESSDQLTGASDDLFRRIASSHLPGFQAELTRVLHDASRSLETEITMNHVDGSTRWFLCRAAEARDDEGRAVRLSGSLTDITAFKQTQVELKRIAERDGLTGLANRKFFTDRLDLAITRHRRGVGEAFAVLFLDFDRFKLINDSLGHGVGDQLLISISRRLEDVLPKSAQAARFGGDEFAVLLRGSHEDVASVCDGLLDSLAAPHQLGVHSIVSTASIGVVCSSEEYVEADEMLRDADTAMYEAKSHGRCRVTHFDLAMREQAIQRQDLDRELRQPDVTDQMQLVYQPIVSLADGTISGFEALIRWQHPQRGVVSPEAFIPIAEESGAIVELGAWLFDEVTRQLEAWDRAFGREDLTIAVNVSRKQVLRDEFTNRLAEYASDHRQRAGRVIIEITETAIMDERVDIVPTLRRIRSMGYQLAMDDFGTGYSSLSCLNQYPIDILKIDRSFTMGMELQREFTAVVSAIIGLAHVLDLRLVAEGVETQGQLAQLQALDCDKAQGHLFSKGVSAEEAEALVKRQGQEDAIGRAA
ncbi:EAL domain-containing protein [Mucisphaera sp.]|uniref:EAL domain-containing protein n=1 Tax=Mucisphaera sp. TaxID=2913024 RepID=UPI003D12872F